MLDLKASRRTSLTAVGPRFDFTGPAVKTRPSSSGVVSTRLRISGYRINVIIRNPDATGRPLLICNGIGASLKLFKPFTNEMPDKCCILFDVPGVGRSSAPWLPMRMDDYARIVDGLLDALDVEETDVLGFSWGTGLAQEFASLYPARVNRLILAAGMMGVGTVLGSTWALANMMVPLRYYFRTVARRTLPDLFGGEFRSNRGAVEQYLARVVPPTMRGYYSQWFALFGWSSLGNLPTLASPTLIMAGNDDPIIPLVNAQIMARLIPNARLHVVDDGHLFPLTRAVEFARTVHAFLHDEA